MSVEEKTKPSFREVVSATTMDLDDVGLSFNAERVGPLDFYGLRDSYYGPGFRMSTMPEIVQLVYSSLENQVYKTAKTVKKILNKNWLTGDTGILCTKEGMYVQDHPLVQGREVVMMEKVLEKMLGSHEEKGVIFSDDKSIRFTPHGFKTGLQTSLELSRNSGVIALVNGEENAEKIAKVSEKFKANPYFWALDSADSEPVAVASLNSSYFCFRDRISINAEGDGKLYDKRYSFGVLEDAEEKAIKIK